MKRGTPLRRKSRLKPRRATPRRSSRVHDEGYLQRVRDMPCISRSMTPWPNGDGHYHICAMGLSHPHHMREAADFAGMGKKPSDSFCVPFCFACHRAWHDHSGRFKGCSKEWRIAFAISAVGEVRARLGWKESKDE